MAKSNYQFQKRQKELAKKRKKEEKRQRRLEKKATEAGISEDNGVTPTQSDGLAETEEGMGSDKSDAL